MKFNFRQKRAEKSAITQIKKINISNQNLKEFPTNDFYTYQFSNTEKIDASKNELVSLPYDFFSVFKNLQELDLSHNQLQRLTKSIDEAKKLHKIDLSYNDLEMLPEDFSKLKITELHLIGNELKTLHGMSESQLKLLHPADITSFQLSQKGTALLEKCVQDKTQCLPAHTYYKESVSDIVQRFTKTKKIDIQKDDMNRICVEIPLNYNLRKKLEPLSKLPSQLQQCLMKHEQHILGMDW